MDALRTLARLDFERWAIRRGSKSDGIAGEGDAVKRLKDKLAKALAAERETLQNLAKNSGAKVVDKTTVEQIVHGAHGIKSLICDTSSVPPDKGLIIRGQPISALADKLPEEIYWLLLTGQLPDKEDLAALQAELSARAELPGYVWKVLDQMPSDAHAMCLLNTGILCMERESVFRKRYEEKMAKDGFGDATFEDALTLMARVPVLAAGIYRRKFKKAEPIAPNPKLDWGANYAHMLGIADPKGEFAQLLRLYLVLHCDHESGNVSAMTATTVNSALSDLYYALAAGFNGLAGPLHGLANQECLTWVLNLMKRHGGMPTVDQIKKEAEETIAAKRVIPGYGHGVLRVIDPRFESFVAFGRTRCANDPVFQTVLRVFEAVPAVLKQYPKIKNPCPNVDAASGSLLYHYGLTDQDYYTVLFAVGRTMGITAQCTVARGLMLPIVRPTSVTSGWLIEAAKTAKE